MNTWKQSTSWNQTYIITKIQSFLPFLHPVSLQYYLFLGKNEHLVRPLLHDET